MTTEDAINIIEQVTGRIPLVRGDQIQVMQAIQLLKQTIAVTPDNGTIEGVTEQEIGEPA